MRRRAPRFAALLVALALAGAALVSGPQAAADEYSDAVLEAFASATIEVSRRIEAWRPHIEGAADEDERDALVEEARADIARAIEEAEGLAASEYHTIFEAAREDEALRARIEGILATLAPRSSAPRAE